MQRMQCTIRYLLYVSHTIVILNLCVLCVRSKWMHMRIRSIHKRAKKKYLIWAGFEPETAWTINHFHLTNELISCVDHDDQRNYCEIHSVHCLFNNWNSIELQRYWCQRASCEYVDAFPKEQTRALPIWAIRSLSYPNAQLISAWIWFELSFHTNIHCKTATNRSW